MRGFLFSSKPTFERDGKLNPPSLHNSGAMALSSYLLSDAESRRIFEEEIAPNELQPSLVSNHHHRDDGKQPLAVLIVGQTGAGKTRLAPVLLDAVAAIGRTPAHFIADTYKAYHPAYAGIVAEKPAIASPATGTDARKWLAMACERAVELRLDVLVESACRHPDDFRGLAATFHSSGYVVLVAVLAVREELSLLGTAARYYRKLPEARSGKLPLRLTPRKVHDESYAGLSDAAAFVDESPDADAVVVVRRGELVAYSNRRVPGGSSDRAWRGPGTVRGALEVERERPLTRSEMEAATADLQVLGSLGDSPADERIQEIRGLIDKMQGAGGGNDVASSRTFPELVPLDAVEFVNSGFA